MKTITESLFYVAILSMLGLANFYFLIEEIVYGKWALALLSTAAVIGSVIVIRQCYLRAKRIEEQMQRDIQSLTRLLAFELLRIAFECHPVLKPNGFGSKPQEEEP